MYTKICDARDEPPVPAWTQLSGSDTNGPVARPKTGETPIQHVRAPQDEWDEYKAAAALVGSDASKITREFVRWFTRRPGAKLPERPTAKDLAQAKASADGRQ